MNIRKRFYTRHAAALGMLLSVCILFLGGGLPVHLAAAAGNGIVVYIDPGHQMYADNALEPVGPGAGERKAKVSSGTIGIATKKPEYVLNLEVSLLLKKELELRGYYVGMTRETHDVNISNRERAEMANKAHADLVLRIHADGDNSARTKGFSVLFPAAEDPFTRTIYEASKSAADEMLAALLEGTGSSSKGVIPRGDLTGFNWSEVPNILVEMGFMSNPEEDKRLSEPSYQDKLAKSMADGVDRYFTPRLDGDTVEESTSVDLAEETPFYRVPSARAAEWGRLVPQTVESFESRKGWRHIRTWLGDAWVRAAN